MLELEVVSKAGLSIAKRGMFGRCPRHRASRERSVQPSRYPLWAARDPTRAMYHQSSEMQLLDDLLGGSMSLDDAARHLFGGDFAHLLGSVRRMQADGYLTASHDGNAVPDWQLAAWQREAATAPDHAKLPAVELRLTEKGLAFW